MFFFACIGFGLQVSDALNPQTIFIIRTLCILLSTAITIGTMFVPKLATLNDSPPLRPDPLLVSGTTARANKAAFVDSSIPEISIQEDATNLVKQKLDEALENVKQLKKAYRSATGKRWTASQSSSEVDGRISPKNSRVVIEKNKKRRCRRDQKHSSGGSGTAASESSAPKSLAHVKTDLRE